MDNRRSGVRAGHAEGMPPFSPATSPVDDRVSEADLRDPAAFLRDLAAVTPLAPGLLVALVAHPSTEQRLVRAVRVDGDLDLEQHQHEASLFLRGVADLIFADEDPDRPVEHSFVSVVVRPGRCVFVEGDSDVLVAWRYANHLLPVLSGDLLLVTPSGWSAFFDDSAGHEPTMVAEVAEVVD